MTSTSLVETHLAHYCGWSHVRTEHYDTLAVVLGQPQAPVYPTACVKQFEDEIVVPVAVEDGTCLKKFDWIFSKLAANLHERPSRLVLGCYGTDGSVVYYIVHDGVKKPRKN